MINICHNNLSIRVPFCNDSQLKHDTSRCTFLFFVHSIHQLREQQVQEFSHGKKKSLFLKQIVCIYTNMNTWQQLLRNSPRDRLVSRSITSVLTLPTSIRTLTQILLFQLSIIRMYLMVFPATFPVAILPPPPRQLK